MAVVSYRRKWLEGPYQVDEKKRRGFNIKFAVILAIAAAGMYVAVMLKTAEYF